MHKCPKIGRWERTQGGVKVKVPADTATAGAIQDTDNKAKKKNFKQDSKLKVVTVKV